MADAPDDIATLIETWTNATRAAMWKAYQAGLIAGQAIGEKAEATRPHGYSHDVEGRCWAEAVKRAKAGEYPYVPDPYDPSGVGNLPIPARYLVPGADVCLDAGEGQGEDGRGFHYARVIEVQWTDDNHIAVKFPHDTLFVNPDHKFAVSPRPW